MKPGRYGDSATIVEVTACRHGFTLVELLSVIVIAAILAALAVPALQSVQSNGSFASQVFAISDSLNLARTYAMANNTHVYFGIVGLDRNQSTVARPQVTGTGRIAVAIVATTDGTSDYSATGSPWTTDYASAGANLLMVRQVEAFDGLFIPSTTATFLGSGNMQLPTNNTAGTTVLPIPTVLPAEPTAPVTPFSLPIGSTLTGGKHNFNTNYSLILCFSPEGGLSVPGATTAAQMYEIDFQPMRGSIAPSFPGTQATNKAAIVIDAVTGAVTVYRP